MFRLTPKTLVRSIPILLLACLSLITLPAPAVAAERHILFLYGEKTTGSLITVYRPIVQSAFRAGSADHINFYEEYMDLSQFPGDDYQSLLRGFYRQKYRGQRFDLIISQSPPVLSFLLNYGDELFPKTPIVFFSVEKSRFEGLNKGLRPNFTGVLFDLNYGATLDAALRMQPAVKRVVVIGGVSEADGKYLAKARTEFRKFEGRIEFIYLTDLPMEELERQMAGLPGQTIAILVNFFRDAAGQAFAPIEAMARIAKASSVPIYCPVDDWIEAGSIGGFVWSKEAETREIPKIGLRVLSGEKPEDIPIRVADTNRYMFDWRQLRRWGIDERSVPPGSIVVHKEPTVWEQYKWHIVAVVSLCILQAPLIVNLLISRRRRRLAEEAKNKFAAIVESSDDAILSKTLDGTITSWNAGAEKMYGYTASEIVGRHVSTLVPGDLREEVRAILERIRRGESMDHRETARVTADGRRIDVSLTISPIKDEHGTIIGASAIARDITERKQAERERRDSEEQFFMMADRAPVMIFVTDANNSCTFCNRQWLKFTGRTMAQELGHGWAQNLHPEDRQRSLETCRSAASARRAFTMEYRIKGADGQYCWIVSTGVPRLLPNGDFAGYIGSCFDINELKRDEQALHHLTGRLLLLQDEERQRVAAELHDGLGQSLAIIRNRAVIGLRNQTNPDRIMEQLEEISETAAAAIIEVRQIAHNLRPYELDRLGLVAAIESMIERVSESTSISLSAHLERIEGLLSPESETNVYRIVQEALNNVLNHSNATAARIEITKSGNQMTISVQDNGKGISALDSAHNDNNSGGFGLAGIAERVRVLGGSLVIDSQPARGTTLTIRLESSRVAAE